MGLLDTFYPNEIQDSTYVIPFEKWKEKEYDIFNRLCRNAMWRKIK